MTEVLKMGTDNRPADMDDGLEFEVKAVCKKYEGQGKEILVLVAEQDHCQWFGTPTATQFATQKYHFIFKFFNFCQDVHGSQKNRIKVKVEASTNPGGSSPDNGTQTLDVLDIPETDTVEDFNVEDNVAENICENEVLTDKKNRKLKEPVVKLELLDTGLNGDNVDLTTLNLGDSAQGADVSNDSKKEITKQNKVPVVFNDSFVREYFEDKCDKNYSCSKCGFRFLYKEHLKTHEKKRADCGDGNFIQRHTKAAILREQVTYKHPQTGEMVTSTYQSMLDNQKTGEPCCCFICNKSFKTPHDLSRHVIGHNTKLLYGCNICNSYYRLPKMLVYHTKLHLLKPYECDSCPKRFESDGERTEHMTTDCQGCVDEIPEGGTDNSSLSCDQCNYKAPNQIVLKAHCSGHDGSKLCVCALCGKQVTSMASLKRHVVYYHKGGRPFRCPICNEKTFKEKAGLTRHMKTHGEKVHSCETCGKSFCEKSNLSAHMKIHSDEKPFVCDFCGKAYKKKLFFDNHRRIHTGDRPYKCDQEGCGKAFRSHSSLTQHKRTHKTDAYICDICGRKFKQPNALNHHRKSHTVEWRWPCSYCQEKYNSIWKFKRHLAQCHPNMRDEIEEKMNIKLHQCDICQKMYHDTEDLRRHINNHNGIRPFQCSVCGKSYSDRSNLKTHVLTHTGGKKFGCKVCHKKFIYEKNLIDHIDRKHTKLPDGESELVGGEPVGNNQLNIPETDFELRIAPLQILE